MKKFARTQLFFRRLADAEACANAASAYELLKMTLDQVEDQYSGVPYNPATWQSDGRLYMPQEDNSSVPASYQNVTRYRSVAHATYIAANGAYMIQDIASGRVVVDRPGKDGRLVADFAIT